MSRLAQLALGREPLDDAQILLLGCFEGEAPPTSRLNGELREAANELAARGGWKGREGQQAEADLGGDSSPRVIALRGLGKRAELDSLRLKQWLTRTVARLSSDGFSRIAFALPDHYWTTGACPAERLLTLLLSSDYRFDRFLTKAEQKETRVEKLIVVPPEGQDEVYSGALPSATAVAEAATFARNLGNTPGNEANPEWMAARSIEMAEKLGFRATVIEGDELHERGMGGLLAVGGGSTTPPRLVRLERGDSGPVVALVGKGITFDTGGISIKPARSMEEMKYDKCGACTVLGIAHAAAAIDLPVRLRAYLAFAENMPDGKAYRPGDIVRCYNGTSVEVLNTDAEGRMILADAMALAVEEGAETLVEFSTLTGACVIALGLTGAGLFTPDDGLANELLEAAGRCGERLWRMPLWPEFTEEMKGNHADLKNTSERWGSANTAAAFLGQFVGELERWAHIDIAGPASTSKGSSREIGATGYGIAFGIDWLRRLAGG